METATLQQSCVNYNTNQARNNTFLHSYLHLFFIVEHRLGSDCRSIQTPLGKSSIDNCKTKFSVECVIISTASG